MIRRFIRSALVRFHKLCRYQYKSAIDISKKRIVVENRDYSLFDPYVFYLGKDVFIACSERKNNSIVAFNLDNPTKKKTILLPRQNSWEEKVNRACLLKVNGSYYLWYTGQSEKKSCIGLAISRDGHIFKRISDLPIITPTLPSEKQSVMNPSVLFDDGIFKMWYSGGGFYEPDCIFYAESNDGINWRKRPEPVLKKGNKKYDKFKVGGCDVHKNANGHYIMFYIGYQNIDVARICKASSIDGLKWQRDKNNPFVCPTKGLWDSDSCYKPAYYLDKNTSTEYIFYNGRKGNLEQICCVALD